MFLHLVVRNRIVTFVYIHVYICIYISIKCFILDEVYADQGCVGFLDRLLQVSIVLDIRICNFVFVYCSFDVF